MKVQSRAAGLEASKFVEKHEAATMKSVDEEAANKFDPIIYFNYSVLYTKERVRKNSTDHKSPPRLSRRPRPLQSREMLGGAYVMTNEDGLALLVYHHNPL